MRERMSISRWSLFVSRWYLLDETIFFYMDVGDGGYGGVGAA